MEEENLKLEDMEAEISGLKKSAELRAPVRFKAVLPVPFMRAMDIPEPPRRKSPEPVTEVGKSARIKNKNPLF